MDTAAPASTRPAYEALARSEQQIFHLTHFSQMASWDRAAMMPPKGNEARAAAEAELEGMIHRLRTDPQRAKLLESARTEPLDELERANLDEMRRLYLQSSVPGSLVERQVVASARCEHAWRTQRFANDWKGFLPNLIEVVALAREESRHLSQALGVPPYEALMERFEPGMTCEKLDRLFGDLASWLPPVIERVRAKQAREDVVAPRGPFPVERQRALSLAVLRLLGFDFDQGRLDVSAHPFCGGVPDDVRLTTRFSEDDFTRALMSSIHECGHGRYNQNLPRAWRGQPIGHSRSSAIHESQSLAFEMQLARSPAFVGLLAPLVREAFGDQPAFETANLERLFTRVNPENRIRVAADELTYALHVILRYRIERALIEGTIACADIPAMWDESMQSLLGLDTRGDYKDGCMQDVHWGTGLFAYFPTYTLGALYAAQWFASIRARHPDLDARVATGDLVPVFDWLRDNIWSQGRRWPSHELARRATGSDLDPAHFRRHLESRYL
ncbi:MAG TPA: carboxypeptidase M32 [Usitatibacter sp.]|nr:carboxypeptidase M32 [Usitatibacter sp.]